MKQLELEVREVPKGIDLVTHEAPACGILSAGVEVRHHQRAHEAARLAGRLCAQPLGNLKARGPAGAGAAPAPWMRIWFDMTASAHPVVFRPVIERLRAAGHEISITARDYSQTVGILDRYGMDYTLVGRHAGASRPRKVMALVSRTTKLHRWARGSFDLAVAHGSNDLALAAAWARIPAVNMFDYEFAIQQHHIGCRLARRVITPDAIPPSRLRRFGVDDEKLRQYPGLKEEYYLADFQPDPTILDQLGVDATQVVVVVRPPPDVSLYHRKSNPLFPRVLSTWAIARACRRWCCPAPTPSARTSSR